MKRHIPEISLDRLTPKQVEVWEALDVQPYGVEFIGQVLHKLYHPRAAYRKICHSHKDNCGIGLFLEATKPVLGTAYDGTGPWDLIVEFESREECHHWMAQQSDRSMALLGEHFNNQPLTRLRFEWFLEPHYSPIWNDFCLYAHSR